jgi:hypothetical protein
VTGQEGDVLVVRDLWAGADVRWAGPEATRKGIRLRPGERAVVTEAGRHHVTSFGSLYYPAWARPPRPGRGVRIRLALGDEVTVPRKHLELIPPDHPLTPEPDGTQADWWLEQLDPRGDLRRGLGRLGRCPGPAFPQRGAHRDTGPGSLLLRGPLTSALSSVAASNIDRPAAGLWWPADRAWFVATEIDFEWTFVAGTQTLMQSMLDDERLEVAPTSFDAPANRAFEPT